MQVAIRVWRTKEAFRRDMIRRSVDGSVVSDTSDSGAYVLMRPDGQVDGFVPSVVIQSYLAHKMSREITPAVLDTVTSVCGLAVGLLARVPNTTPDFALEIALATRGLAEDVHVKIMTQLVFRGELFQYHLFDAVEPAPLDATDAGGQL